MKTVYIIFGRTLRRGVCHGHGDYSDDWVECVACRLAFTSQAVANEYMAAHRFNPENAPLIKAEEYAVKPFPVQS